MDTRASENTETRTLRRSTRHSLRNKVLNEPDLRGPLKRTKRVVEKQAPVAAINGSRDVENGSEDEESPSKRRRLRSRGEGGSSGDENEMDVDVKEPDEDVEKNEDQEMDIRQDSSRDTHQVKICKDALGDVNYSPRVVLEQPFRSGYAVNETRREKTSTKGPVTPTKSVTQIRLQTTGHDVPTAKFSTEEYQRKMKAFARSADIRTVNHHVQTSVKSHARQQPVNNILKQKESVQQKKTGIKKTADTKTSPARSSRGFMWCFWCLVLPVLLSTSAVLLGYKIIPVLQRSADVEEQPSRAVKLQQFADHLSHLETQFPSQRPELWKRSKIHLEKHLKTAHPTEPVSLIFTAGQRAEQTMRCLAQRLASSFSSALNASVLHIDGASKASQDSDVVKLDIDSQLQAGFEGDKPVAVIHRFEELPPGSTLIFYRYCDHENAAYKRVFLLFTVLLPRDEVTAGQSLKQVEEMVQDYVQERLVSTSHHTTFNDMDADKFSGLWSRISHLILPVVSEEEVEQRGCQ